MVRTAVVTQSLRMTSPVTPPTTTTRTCCRRSMSSIEVTTRGTTLVLHSCTACGRHLWEKDGQTADRAELLDGVKTFLEQPRVPTPRRSSKRS
jgi:hypothetical protein